MAAEKPILSILSFSPFRCRMWAQHDRAEEHITEENCRDEIASFAKHGQLVASLGRRLHNDPTHDIELIFGARRLFVARHLNLPLRVEIREMTDRDAIIAMDIENRQRCDISPYERGLSYARWLREGHFGAQDEIAAALKVSPSQVSRLLKVSRLPPVILNAFASPSEICESSALDLAAALEDSTRREPTIRVARLLASAELHLPAREVCRRLLSAGTGVGKLSARNRDEVVLSGPAGTPLYRLRYTRLYVTLRLPIILLTGEALPEIRSAVTAVLGRESAARTSCSRSAVPSR